MIEFESRLAIEEVLDLETGEIISSKEFFLQSEDKIIHFRRTQQEAISGFANPRFVCPFCHQVLKISGKPTKRGIVSYFAHLYDSEDCEIKTNGIHSKEEIEALKYAGVKESQRHIDLKEKIFRFLTTENSQMLNIKDVQLERRLNSDNPFLNWRKPDIYAEYGDKKIVFELQLSTTFLSVIVARDIFYKLNGIFIIWIFNFSNNEEFLNLDNLMCKDIYYANRRNAFILDEEAMRRSAQENELVLLCKWFEPIIKDGRIFGQERKQEYIKLSNLHLDGNDFKPYYIDADKMFLDYDAQQLSKREHQEIETTSWFKKFEERTIERTKKKEELHTAKLKKIKNELLEGKCKLKPFKINDSWGFKANGEMIVTPVYDYAFPAEDDGYAKIIKNGKYGYVNQIGNEVLFVRYESLLRVEKLILEMENRRLFKEHKLLKWMKNGLIGLTDENENTAIQFIYEEIKSFRDNKAKAKKNGLWGYIDINGKEVIRCSYQDIEEKSFGCFKVKLNNKWGYIDSSEKLIVSNIYDELGDFNENETEIRQKDKTSKIKGLAQYICCGKRGYVTKWGKEYWQYWKEWDVKIDASQIPRGKSEDNVDPKVVEKIRLPIYKKN